MKFGGINVLAEERQNAIVEQVNRDGSVLVKELSERFGVTDDSIRKDLTLLEKKGLLKKTYGGAIKVRVNVHDYDVSKRKGKNVEQKGAIAKKAMGLINDGDMVFLDISTVNLELAKLLMQSNMSITIVTNMIDIMITLTASSKIKLIFVGGTLNDTRDGFVGSLTNQLLKDFQFDIAFMGVVGVDLQRDSVATYKVEDGITKKIILESSHKAYMMLETRKFATDGNYKYAKLDDFAGAILEREPESRLQEEMKKYLIEWIS